jgi:uridylate kinase
MNSTFSLIRGRLDACKKEVIELEEMNNQIREAMDTVPFTLRYRQQIEVTVLRCAKKITLLKSRVLNTETLSKHTEVR